MRLFLLCLGLGLLYPSVTNAGNYHTSMVHDQKFGVLSETCARSMMLVADFWDSRSGFDSVKNVNTYRVGKPSEKGVRIESSCSVFFDEKGTPHGVLISLLFFAKDGVRTGRAFFKVDLMANKVTQTR